MVYILSGMTDSDESLAPPNRTGLFSPDEKGRVFAEWAESDPLFLEAGLAQQRRRAFLQALAALRKRLDVTQEQVAERMESTQPAVARLEAGRGDPRISTLERYAAALGMRLEINFAPPSDEVLRGMPGEEKRDALAAGLAEAVHRRADQSQIISLLQDTTVYALGEPVVGNRAAGTNLLHVTVNLEEGDGETVLLPVFTGPNHMREALLRNSQWLSLAVLEVNGGDLLHNIDRDVTIVINPWSDLQYLTPAPGATTISRQVPSTGEAEFREVDAGKVVTEAKQLVATGVL